MRLRSFFLLGMVIALLFALALLLGPDTILKFFGFTTGKTEVLLAKTIGAGLIGVGLLCWFAKDFTDPAAVQGVNLSLFVAAAVAFVVALLGILSQTTRSASAWLIVVLFLAFALGFAYFQFIGPRE
ncbi:MAG TPA: hypothetical protein VMJ64_01475 [Anaerolineales bacterium]|nr:hypothetical protein [Anaerolineales bacterium]